MCQSVRTIKSKLLKPKLPNLAKVLSITIPHPTTNIRLKGQRSRSQGHKVHNVEKRQPCGIVLRLCRRTRRSRMAVSSRDDTTTVHTRLSYSRRSIGRHQLCTLSSAQPLVIYIYIYIYTLWPIKNNHLDFLSFLCQFCINLNNKCSRWQSVNVLQSSVKLISYVLNILC